MFGDKVPIFLIQINYKSGLIRQLWFKHFTVKQNSGAITELNWELAKNEKFYPLFIGVNDIESIFVVEKKYI